MPETQESFDPRAELDAAVYLLQNGGDYKVAYDTFRGLYNEGLFREDTLFLLTGAFYEPNVEPQRRRYAKNRRLLEKYPYLFRRDFPVFEELPIRFYPYDDAHYCPFFAAEERFGEPVDPAHPVVSRNFFHDLERPVLAADVFSQYELEYLHDNVRPSEWVGRENHVYLHYTDWAVFCAHLQVLELDGLLKSKKLVFLIGEELEQYPIDFKERFGVDYGGCPVRPVGLREICRLIWHTQLSAHNGGDFFNEIFDDHPNLIALDSVMMTEVEAMVASVRSALKKKADLGALFPGQEGRAELRERLTELQGLKKPTDKDIFLACYIPLANTGKLDPASRIVPAVFFQPHFPKYHPKLQIDGMGRLVSDGEERRSMEAPAFQGFQYIKTFTPVRRPTTSLAATARFMRGQHSRRQPGDPAKGVHDEWCFRLLQRSYLISPEDRLFRDSAAVRFEDAKEDPKAVFAALATFLDLPYTESMTYCSIDGRVRADGFRTDTVEARYEEFLGPEERYLLEYFLRDAYESYGYGFQNYDGAPLDEERLARLVAGLTGFTDFIREAQGEVLRQEGPEEALEEKLDAYMAELTQLRQGICALLLRGPAFVDPSGAALVPMPRLSI